MPNNLSHALKGMCKDRDCELHHIEVGIAEETVDDTNVAFFLAGAARMLDSLKIPTLTDVEGLWWEFVKTINEA